MPKFKENAFYLRNNNFVVRKPFLFYSKQFITPLSLARSSSNPQNKNFRPSYLGKRKFFIVSLVKNHRLKRWRRIRILKLRINRVCKNISHIQVYTGMFTEVKWLYGYYLANDRCYPLPRLCRNCISRKNLRTF